MRYSFVESKTRTRHGSIACKTTGENYGLAWFEDTTNKVVYFLYNLRTLLEFIIVIRLSSLSNLISDRHDRPNVFNNLSLGGSAQDLYRWTYKTEIAEMETVL